MTTRWLTYLLQQVMGNLAEACSPCGPLKTEALISRGVAKDLIVALRLTLPKGRYQKEKEISGRWKTIRQTTFSLNPTVIGLWTWITY